jgi:hypothetical protein
MSHLNFLLIILHLASLLILLFKLAEMEYIFSKFDLQIRWILFEAYFPYSISLKILLFIYITFFVLIIVHFQLIYFQIMFFYYWIRFLQDRPDFIKFYKFYACPNLYQHHYLIRLHIFIALTIFSFQPQFIIIEVFIFYYFL